MDSFEKELRAAQVPLYDFIRALCGGHQDAEDILGEANLSILRQRAAYDGARSFLPWARAFAYNAVLRWRTRNGRSHLVFGEDLVEQLAVEAPSEDAPAWWHRADLLEQACRELTPEMQYALRRYYTYGDSLGSIARQLHRTAASVASSLYYIRGVLRRSVEKKIEEEKHG